jgi:branched-chain amino acid transport system permease protein
MLDTNQLFPFLVSGLGFGAVYAMSGTGLLVLYRTTGVLNFSFGAIGAFGASIAWSTIENGWAPDWVAYLICIAVCAAINLTYGVLLAPRYANRDDLNKMLGTLGLALILLGLMFNLWKTEDARVFRLPTGTRRIQIEWFCNPEGKDCVFDARITYTQILAVVFAFAVAAGVTMYLKRTKTGTAMRAIANDREISSLLGIPVRRIEAVAWLGSGVLCGIVGLLLVDLFGSLDVVLMTWFVIPALAPVLVGRLRYLWVAFFAAFAIGVIEAELNASTWEWPSLYRKTTAYVVAIGALLWFARKRTLVISGRATR